MLTHEQYLAGVYQHVATHAASEDADRLTACRITYGAGQPGLRGVTYYDRWERGEDDSIALVEVCALAEESPVQCAGTLVHELAHVVAGFGAGHGPEWKSAADRLGLRLARAAGHRYLMAGFEPKLREHVYRLAQGLADGRPNGIHLPGYIVPRPCPMGIGTRGGKSRGKGSGSRMVKAVCENGGCGCVFRMARKWIEACAENGPRCPVCGGPCTHD